MRAVADRITYANVTATLALVLAMSGGAIAASGGFGSGGQLRACANGEGALRLLKSGHKCKKGQTLVSWGQTGTAGANGATGATGAAGAPGTPGTIGPQGPKGDSSDVKWALVSDDGVLEAGHGVRAAAESLTPTVHYAVAFDEDITKCGLIASIDEAAPDWSIQPEHAGTEADVYIRDPQALAGLSQFSIVAYC